MTVPSKAVFVSYASQDAEAARRVAEGLRAEGVEVWFDQNELTGGDAWDAKIRRQIAACELFLPLVSANTEARLEGYFRLEWKIAAQRMQTMAEEKAFLLPIVIDGTRDAAAKVPSEFKSVQWTKLPGGETTPAFRARVKKLLEAGGTWVEEPQPGSAAATRVERTQKPYRWIGYAWAVFGIGIGLYFATQPLWRGGNRAGEASSPKTAAQPAEPAKTAAPAASVPAPKTPKFEPQQVVLTRFENLTGDPALDPLARVIEAELLRNFGQVQQARVQPVEVSGRAAGRKAATEAGAATFVVGSFLRSGDKLELTAQVVFTEQGELLGTAGPVVVPAVAGRSDGLTELAERLTTGVSNAVATMLAPPTRLAAVIYTRPWPRYSVVPRVSALRALPPDKFETVIAGYRQLLAEAPELLRVKHDLARLLRDSGRLDEAQKLFAELQGEDSPRLSQQERLAIAYDDALLTGDPNRALEASRAQLELRPVGDAISQVVACLWGLNRPRAAYQELSAWWEKHQSELPPQSRGQTYAGLLATTALMHLMYDEYDAALAKLVEMEKALAGYPYTALPWLRFVTFGELGREEDQRKLIAEMASTPGSARLEPLALQWMAYQQALHLGRPEAAARWLADMERLRAEIERTGRTEPELDTVLMWLHDAAGRPEEALKVNDRIVQRLGETVNTVGSRAVFLRELGRIQEAEAEERRVERWERRNTRGLPAFWRARIAARAGDKERAVGLLREAIAGGLWFGGFNSPTFNFGRSEPDFAKLRGYAPYEELIKPKG
jgi:tetratricopeptide (TPR) repeat protein